ncbi:Fumarylacetoacetase-like C-terminal domain-containing protein [Novosphingobium lubricantis]|jgi:2-keto-4-pentenoate hydratase/2-oxohepta-3-ene-1,7-dioic acid hydratase in catechol pathway
MKLCRFTENGTTRIGKVVDDTVVDLSAVTGASNSMRDLLGRFDTLRAGLEAAKGPAFALAAVTLEAPINDPQKFLAIGMNYQAHADEAAAAGIPIPTSQLWFNKQVSCITGPYHEVELPKVSEMVDYEAELGFVIGKTCRHVSEDDALSVIAGYFVCNDVSVRDWQARSPTFTLGKSFDTHGPIGPWITTSDDITDPHALMLHLSVNGEERQRSSTGDMIYDIRKQVAYLSTVMTLEPGDIVATGTPAGVGIASNSFLKPGDVVRVEVDGLGHIENTFVPEQ